MRKFYTAFDVAPSINKDKVYDRHDNVNRVSYVDSTQLVRRFILEGKNLNAARAAALRSGMYSGDELDNIDDPIIPVYEQDPAISKPIIDAAKNTLKSRVAEAERKRSESVASSKSDLTENHQDSNSNSDS